jgi:hypothetical protein
MNLEQLYIVNKLDVVAAYTLKIGDCFKHLDDQVFFYEVTAVKHPKYQALQVKTRNSKIEDRLYTRYKCLVVKEK